VDFFKGEGLYAGASLAHTLQSACDEPYSRGPLASRLPGMGVVVHSGRKTTGQYSALVMIFRRPEKVVVGLTRPRIAVDFLQPGSSYRRVGIEHRYKPQVGPENREKRRVDHDWLKSCCHNVTGRQRYPNPLE
jgi:hypothetical protein